MAVQEFTPETLEQLAKAGITNEPTSSTLNETTTPDIDYKPQDEPKTTESAITTHPNVFDAFVTKKLEAGGFNIADVQARMLKDGGISPEFATELKAKIDPDLVDTYITGLAEAASKTKVTASETAEKNAAQKLINDFIYDSVGGKDKFETLAATLKSKIPQNEIDIINAKLASPNKALVAEGVKEAVDKYKQLTGRVNTRMEGNPSVPTGTPAQFMTKAQYHKIMTSEKYKTDPVYAKQIDEQRLASRKLDSTRTLPGQYYGVHEGELYTL